MTERKKKRNRIYREKDKERERGREGDRERETERGRERERERERSKSGRIPIFPGLQRTFTLAIVARFPFALNLKYSQQLLLAGENTPSYFII